MNKKTITIDAENFDDLETFFDEIDRVLTKDLDWETGHNLNAFHDILCGGFGVFDYDEHINLIWKNIAKSKRELGNEMVEILVSIILEEENINFIEN